MIYNNPEHLKDWIKDHFSDYDKSRFDLYMKEKEAYHTGIDKFVNKFPVIHNPKIYILLKHESGLAEVARVNNNIGGFALHLFRQIEVLYNDLFDLSDLGQSEIVLKQGQIDSFETFFNVQYQGIRYDYISTREVSMERVDDNGTVIENSHVSRGANKPLGYTYDNNGEYIILTTTRGRYQVRNDDKIQPTLTAQSSDVWNPFSAEFRMIQNPSINPSFNKLDKLFKRLFYFTDNGARVYNNIESILVSRKPQLNALISIKHYRDVFSHNIASASNVKEKFIRANINPTPEDRLYLQNPEAVLGSSSNYYQGYVDAIISMYSAYMGAGSLQNYHQIVT